MALDLFCCFFSAQAEALVQLNWIDLSLGGFHIWTGE